jgi:Fe-Mn family superoxide dismutase
MEIHHTKHYQTYTDKLNAALVKCPFEIQQKDIQGILSILDQVTGEQKCAINFKDGGFDNHRAFWNNMKSIDGAESGCSIADAKNESFGSSSDFNFASFNFTPKDFLRG